MLGNACTKLQDTLHIKNRDSIKSTNVGVHLGRLFFFFFLFLIPFTASVTSIFLQDVMWAFSRDPSTNNVGMDYTLGLFWFSYRIDDVDYVNGTLPYSASWTTQSYASYCRTVPFQTQESDGYLIDHDFFCGKHQTIPIWILIQSFSVFSVVAGLFAFAVYVENFLLWKGWNPVFSYYLDRYKDRTVKCVRRVFKALMLLGVLFHAIFQIASVSLIAHVVIGNVIASPSNVQLFYSFYVGLGIAIFDVIFLILYSILDSYTFFHTPIDFPQAFHGIL